MTRKAYASLAFQVFLIVALALATWQAHDWPRETRLFPYAVGRVALLLAVIVFVNDVLKVYRERSEPPVEAEVEYKEDGRAGVDAVFVARAAREFAWVAGFAVAAGCLGFYPAVFLFLFAYLKVRARMSVLGAVVWAAASTGAFYLVFYEVLNVRPYTGLIGRWW